jgi:hypothetical protein
MGYQIVHRRSCSARRQTATHIGPTRRTYVVEPLESPVPAKRAAPVPKEPPRPVQKPPREPKVPAA